MGNAPDEADGFEISDAAGSAGRPDFAGRLHALLARLVTAGAALGWVDAPPLEEVRLLLGELAAQARVGDTALVVAVRPGSAGSDVLGFGYWRRYARPTHRPHADLEKVFVDPDAHGRGVGRALVSALVERARAAEVEVLTLDFRGDNHTAEALYRSLGFTEYGRLSDFVAVGGRRFDKVLYAIDLRSAGSPG